MTDMIIAALLLTLPIVIGGVLHMMAVSKGWLSSLATPLQSRRFGPNKTWRGVVLMPAFTVLGAYPLYWLAPALSPELAATLAPIPAWLLGLALGLGYILLELPNSWIKRRLGIPAGETPRRFSGLFILIDQWDSAIGFALAYALLTELALATLAGMVLLFPFVALFVKRLLYWAKWKEKYV
ncbi:CDP-archaeol synthase [Marinobacteraceae bacterium S3BR75-40.1]